MERIMSSARLAWLVLDTAHSLRYAVLWLVLCAALVNPHWQNMLIVALFAMGGVHGGFDLPLILRRWVAPYSLLVLVAYALIAFACFVAYRVHPNSGALVLLVLSAYHFGFFSKFLPRFASGVAMLSATLAHDPAALAWLGSSLLLTHSTWVMVCFVAVCTLVVSWALQKKSRPRASTANFDLLCTLLWTALALLLPPLLWVASFFCFEHAWRHHQALPKTMKTNRAYLLMALAALIAPLLILVSTVSVDVGGVQNYFGPLLLALTVPHMLLIDGYRLLGVDQAIIPGAHDVV
jgi:Brp/Blh family beta-carotene 15,15'-monooxygenase